LTRTSCPCVSAGATFCLRDVTDWRIGDPEGVGYPRDPLANLGSVIRPARPLDHPFDVLMDPVLAEVLPVRLLAERSDSPPPFGENTLPPSPFLNPGTVRRSIPGGGMDGFSVLR
jgi:hypothetical protein